MTGFIDLKFIFSVVQTPTQAPTTARPSTPTSASPLAGKTKRRSFCFFVNSLQTIMICFYKIIVSIILADNFKYFMCLGMVTPHVHSVQWLWCEHCIRKLHEHYRFLCLKLLNKSNYFSMLNIMISCMRKWHVKHNLAIVV